MAKKNKQKYKVREQGLNGYSTIEADDVTLKEEGIVFYMDGGIIAIYPLGTVVELMY